MKRPLETDLSIYRRFNFEHPPVGVKYLVEKPELKSYLNDDRWYVVRNLIRILGTIGDESVVETMLPFLSHDNPKVRRESILSLLKIGSAKAFYSLTLALNDQDSAVQAMAVNALAEIGQKRAVPILEDFLKKRAAIGKGPKKSAIEALGKIGGKDVTTTLFINSIKRREISSMIS